MSETKQDLPEQFSDILLVLDQKKNEIRAVKGLDKKGNLETTEAKEENNQEFMRVDKHGDILSNFYDKLRSLHVLSFSKFPENKQHKSQW